MKSPASSRTAGQVAGYAVRFFSGAMLLLSGVYGTLFCFFQSFYLPEAQTALYWALPTALLFLTLFLLPKHRGIAYLAAFLVWGALSALALRQVVSGAVFVAEQFSTQASVVFTGLGHFAPPQSQEDLAACRMFFRVVQFPLVGYLAWAVIKARSFFFSFLATAPFLGIAAVVGLLPSAWALVLLVGFWAALLLSGRASRAGQLPAAKAGLILAPFAFLLTALLVLCAPPDSYRPSDSVARVRSELLQAASELLEAGESASPSPTLGAPMTGSPGSTDLTNAGELNFTGQTALRVQMEQPQSLYLRAWAGAVYTGSSWEVPSAEAYEEMGVSFQPLLYTRDALEGLGGGGDLPEAFSLTVENISANRAYLYHPYQLARLESPQAELSFTQDAYIGSIDGVYTLSFYSPLREAVQARISARVKERERAYERQIEQLYTQLPEGIRAELLAYAEQAGLEASAGPEDWLRTAQAVASVVAGAGAYTERPGPLPEGEDFVLYFLTERPQGYCIHFASAAAALMRALDVPARYVEGYTVKENNFNAEGNAEIPDRQAHAWVEVWVDGQGWTPVEATPGGAATLREESDTDAASHETLPTQAPTQGDAAAPEEPKTAYWLASALVGLLLIALVAVRLELTRRRKLSFAQKDRNRAALAVYAYLCRLARFGYTISGEAQALARKAKFSRHTLTSEELERLLGEALRAEHTTYDALPLWQKLLFRLLVF